MIWCSGVFTTDFIRGTLSVTVREYWYSCHILNFCVVKWKLCIQLWGIESHANHKMCLKLFFPFMKQICHTFEKNSFCIFLLRQAFLMSTDWMIWFITFPLDNFQNLNFSRDIQASGVVLALVESLVQSYLRNFA